MNFADMTLFMMNMVNMVNKTMQREINNFIKNVKKTKDNYDKSSISKARLNISPELFKDLNEGLLLDIYEDKEEINFLMALEYLE